MYINSGLILAVDDEAEIAGHALEMAMKHFALLTEKVDVTVKADEITARLLAGRERAAKLAGESQG